MKTHKLKIFTLITCLLVLCFTFSACDPGTFYFTSEDFAEVISIELINYDNPEQKRFKSWVPDHTSDLKPFDENKMSRLEILDESKISDFVDYLCECFILDTFFAYDSPNGNCIRLNYSNGDFLIIWSSYIGKFTSDGKVSKFFGCLGDSEYYENLVNNYFQTQI